MATIYLSKPDFHLTNSALNLLSQKPVEFDRFLKAVEPLNLKHGLIKNNTCYQGDTFCRYVSVNKAYQFLMLICRIIHSLLT